MTTPEPLSEEDLRRMEYHVEDGYGAMLSETCALIAEVRRHRRERPALWSMVEAFEGQPCDCCGNLYREQDGVSEECASLHYPFAEIDRALSPDADRNIARPQAPAPASAEGAQAQVSGVAARNDPERADTDSVAPAVPTTGRCNCGLAAEMHTTLSMQPRQHKIGCAALSPAPSVPAATPAPRTYADGFADAREMAAHETLQSQIDCFCAEKPNNPPCSACMESARIEGRLRALKPRGEP